MTPIWPLIVHVVGSSWNNLEFQIQEQGQKGHSFGVHYLVKIQ